MVFITIGLHILNAAVMELFPMWVVYLILFSLIRISIVSQYSYSSRPWCKKRHTRYYCIHRPQTTQHWGPNGFPVWGGVVCNRNCYRVTGSNLPFHVSKHCSRVKSSGKKNGKLVCDLMRTCLAMKWKHKLDPPLPLYSVNNVQSRCGNRGKSSSADAGLKEIDAAVCCSVFHIYRQLK